MGAPLTRPFAGTRFLTLWAVLEYRGRRSGRANATPVAIRRTPDGFVILIPFGTGTQWPHNVLAAGGCTVRWKGAPHIAHDPELIGEEEGALAFNRPQRTLANLFGIRRFLRLRVRPTP